MIQEIFLATWNVQLDTMHLDSIGFKVCSWVCDGAAPNRKFFLISGWKKRKEEDKTGPGIHMHQKEIFFFISDVPHFLKTSRNNLENLHGNNNTRSVHVSYLQY